ALRRARRRRRPGLGRSQAARRRGAPPPAGGGREAEGGRVQLGPLRRRGAGGHPLAAVSVASISSQVAWAVRSQEKRAALRMPRRRRSARSSPSSEIRSRALRQPSTSAGSTSSAASPVTSGSDELSEQTTGVPQAIASSGVSPKPSYQAGWARQVAR